jgi:arylformamidase
MWHDLTQPLEESMPYSKKFDELGTPPQIERVLTHEDDGAAVSYYSMLTHVGTHVDAPLHFVEDGRTIDELPLERFTGPGVCLDVSRDEATEITVDEIERADGEVREDDVVLLYTGWHHEYGTDAYDPHPWLADEVAEWLVEQGVGMVALDTITPDLPGPMRPEGWSEFPVHRELLGNDVLIAEHLTGLEPLTGERLEVFAFPLEIRDGDGAQARFVARIE